MYLFKLTKKEKLMCFVCVDDVYRSKCDDCQRVDFLLFFLNFNRNKNISKYSKNTTKVLSRSCSRYVPSTSLHMKKRKL